MTVYAQASVEFAYDLTGLHHRREHEIQDAVMHFCKEYSGVDQRVFGWVKVVKPEEGDWGSVGVGINFESSWPLRSDFDNESDELEQRWQGLVCAFDGFIFALFHRRIIDAATRQQSPHVLQPV